MPLTPRSTLPPVPRRERSSQEGADIFLILGHPQTWVTLSPSTHLPLPCSSSRSDVPRTASLFCSTFPRHFFVYFRDSQMGTEVGKKTFIVIFKGEIKLKRKEGGWELYFHQKREYQLKVEKKTLRLSLLQFPHYRRGNKQRLRKARQLVQGHTAVTGFKCRSI